MKILVAAGLLFAATFAQAQTESFDFKGIALGSDISALEADKRFMCYSPKSALADRACGLRRKGSETIAGVPIDTLLVFAYDGKVHLIGITFDSSKFRQVSEALQEKYGEGVGASEQVHNRMGASFENESRSWNRPGQQLKADKYSQSIRESRVSFQTDAGTDEFARRNESKTKESAKDL